MVGRERQRALVRARGARRVAARLQRDAVLEVQVRVRRRDGEALAQRLQRGVARAPRDLGAREHPPQRDGARRAGEALPRKARRVVVRALVERELRRREARLDELRRRGDRGRERARARGQRRLRARATSPWSFSAGAKPGCAASTLA